MAEYARQVSEGEFDAYDKIETAVESLGGVDLVLTSGTVQYTPDPLTTLDALIAIGAPYFMLARFPFCHDSMFAVEQAPLSGYIVGPMPPGTPDKMVRCPVTFVKYAEVKTKLENVYDRLLSIPSPSANYQFGSQTIMAGTHVYRSKS
jgi:hypothetical protein